MGEVAGRARTGCGSDVRELYLSSRGKTSAGERAARGLQAESSVKDDKASGDME